MSWPIVFYWKNQAIHLTLIGMYLDFKKMTSADCYRTLIQCLIPRPVAWILTENDNESWNLAPFSFFTGITSNPPILAISVGKKKDRRKKDTWRNIEERKHFVVHIPPANSAQKVSDTAAFLPYGHSEVLENNIELTHDGSDQLPRIRGIPIAMFCRKYAIYEIGHNPQGLILGQIMRIFVDDSIATKVDQHVEIDALKFNPLARLGGNDYGELGKTFTIPRI